MPNSTASTVIPFSARSSRAEKPRAAGLADGSRNSIRPLGRDASSRWICARTPNLDSISCSCRRAPASVASPSARTAYRRVSTTCPAMPYASPTVATRTATPLATHSSRAFCIAGLLSNSICSSSTQAAPTPGALSRSRRSRRALVDRRLGLALRRTRQDRQRPARLDGDLLPSLRHPHRDQRLAFLEGQPARVEQLQRVIGRRRARKKLLDTSIGWRRRSRWRWRFWQFD